MILIIVLFLFLFIILLSKVGFIIFTKGEEYIDRAYDLWTRNIPVSYKRGRILDCNGKLIVGNTISPSLSIIPKQIENKEYTINYLSTILNVPREKLEPHFNKNVSVELIKPEGKNIDLNKAKQIIAEGLKGVYISGDVVRYYPYGNVLSHVLGIVGSDNQGLTGLEYVYDSLLKGEKGSINIFTDAHGMKIDNLDDSYTSSSGGVDIYLTVNIDLQIALETVLDNAASLYDSEETLGLMLNPKTSEVMAICSRPNFDLINYQDYPVETYNRNLPIWMTYEYGSTFKFVTYTAGLEEKVFNTNEHFFCSGFRVVDGTRIRDWKAGGHGDETFFEVMQNSCNPGFMEIGLRLGKEKLFEYIKAYGFGDYTKIDLLGESKGILFDIDRVGNVELATSSFGQGNSGTAIQLVNAACAAVNNGNMNTPYIVKGIGTQGAILYETETHFVRKVISDETSETLRNALERVVSLGTARSAYVEGYRVGGKTGTAQIPVNGVYLENTYILSFLGIAPMNDPSVSCYIAIKAPKTYVQYGGVVVAPLVKDVLTQSFSILGIEKQEGGIPIDSRWYVDNFYYEVENYIGKSTKQVLNHPYYKIKIIGEGNNIIDQNPKKGERIIGGSYVYLYTN